jgi:CRISPR/Cas system-associated exonuclease Cas4 (RecB family)
MKITPELFHAYLKCPTKCWLRENHEQESGNHYAEWFKTQNDQYRATGTERLVATSSIDDVAVSPDEESIKTDKWRLATNLAAHAQSDSWIVESELHAVERVLTEYVFAIGVAGFGFLLFSILSILSIFSSWSSWSS